MSSNKVIKSVSFNIANEEDAAILKAIKRRNFSGYVKALILQDLALKNVAERKIESVEVQEEPDLSKMSPKEKLDYIRRMAKEREEREKSGGQQPPS